MKFKEGDILEFEGANNYSAEKGATAICKGYKTIRCEEYIQVEWIRNGLDNEQENGGYFESQFTKVEEVSTQKEDRIFEEIKKEKVMIKVGDVVELIDNEVMGAKKGATAKVTFINDRWITVSWLDDLSYGQEDGEYSMSRFVKKEKVMKDLKFNFKEGKQRVIKMLEEFIFDFKTDMSQDIKIILIREEEDAIDQVEEILKTIRLHEKYCETAIEKLKEAITVAEVLSAMYETVYEEMEETVLNELFGLKSIVRED